MVSEMPSRSRDRVDRFGIKRTYEFSHHRLNHGMRKTSKTGTQREDGPRRAQRRRTAHRSELPLDLR